MTEKLVKPIHLACGDDETRPILCCVYIKDGHAVATNGHLLVKQKLSATTLINTDQIKLLEGRFIHKAVWKEVFDMAKELRVENDAIVCQTDAGKVIYEFANHAMLFPDVETILDNCKKSPTQQIGLNPKFITIIGKIFDSTKLKFEFNQAKGTMVYPLESTDELAYLMAISID